MGTTSGEHAPRNGPRWAPQAVGDRFVVLKRGLAMCDRDKPELTLDELIGLMSGGAELDALRHELAAAPRPENGRGWGGGG